MAHGNPRSDWPGFALFFDMLDELRKLAKMPALLASIRVIRATGGRQNVDARAIKHFLLNSVLAFALGKLLVGKFAIESHDARSKLLDFLGEDDAAFGKIFALQFFDALGGSLDQVGEPNAKLDDAPIIVVIEGFRNDAAFVQYGPEFIAPPGIVVADAHGRFAGIAADNH